MTNARWWYRQVARVLPKDFRDDAGTGLEEAAIDWLARERARRGLPGLAMAWIGILADTISTAIALRREPGQVALQFSPDDVIPSRGVFDAMLDNFLKDSRFAIRSLWHQPGFTLITVLTLALGIGANTAVFSVLNAVVLKPLPYPQPERLHMITSQFPNIGFDQFWISPPEFLEFRQNNQVYSSVGGYSSGAVNLGVETPVRTISAAVTPGLMETLDVKPLMGRWFTEEDSRPNVEDVAILSWQLWRRSFGSDPQVLGKTVKVNDAPARIVGVMPEGYDVHDQNIEIWLPLTIDPATLPNRRGNHFLYLVGRLKPNLTHEQALADLDLQMKQWRERIPQGHVPNLTTHRLRIDPLKEDIVGSVRTALTVLQAAVAVVLLIACANLANLLIARADTRMREYAVRTALGASRLRLFSQLVTEGLVLSIAGAVLGVALAAGGLQLLLAANPDAIPRTSEIGIDWSVLGFTLLVACATGLIFGLVPLVHLWRDRVGQTLKDSGTRSAAGSVRSRMRSGLVVAETALAVVLVVGAGLLLRSVLNLTKVDMGFNRSNVSTFGLVLPGQSYDASRSVSFYNELLGKLRAIPGVQSAAVISGLPPLRQVDANDTDFEHIPPGRPPGTLPVENVDFWQAVSLDLPTTLGLALVDGRFFEPADVAGAPVVLINEELQKKFYTDRSPIGQRLRIGGNQSPWFSVVGVVKDVKQGGVEAHAGTQLYLLNEQLPRAVGFAYQNMNVVVRSSLPLDALAASFHGAVKSLDPALPLVRMRTMDEVVGDSIARPRFLALLLGVFAGLALALAAVGIYGILSYLVSERRQEIGIRMALGAARGEILRLVLGRGLMLSTIGLTLGLAASFGLTRVLQSMLFAVTPNDPLTLAVVAGVIALVAILACVVPAMRATRVDPLVVLRQS